MDGRPTGFWGKLEQDKVTRTVRSWHPVVDHCADVAACAEALLERTLLRKRLARLARQEDLDPTQVARLCVLVALHDLGKFNHGFQRKADPQAFDTAGHVDEALALFSIGDPWQGRFLEAIQADTLTAWCAQPRTLVALLTASIAHHGRPKDPSLIVANRTIPFWEPTPQRDPLAGLAGLMIALQSWFPKAFEPGGLPLPSSAPFVHGFNGLVSLADWLGSDTFFFPYSAATDPPRFPWAQARACEATERIGLDMRVPREALGTTPIDLGRMGFDGPPRPVQAAMAELPCHETGSLTVLEAPTGEGKTEAAVLRFLRLFQAGDVDGLYFALPTRTAAQEIYKRINDIVARVFPEGARPPVIQAVSGYLKVDGIEGRALPHFAVLWDDDGRLQGRGWAAESPKRYLAGAIVVGTIDQVLLSGLKAKHAHLRAAGLLRLLLAVDEVHASDAYMTRILSEVLRRHRQAGGHALLLSATLAGTARAKYLGQRPPTRVAASEAAYPLVSHTSGLALHPPSSQHKPVRWATLPLAAEPASLAAEALAAARKGAKVLIIRNTVADAIATQMALEAAGAGDLLLSVGDVPAPHHSRFAREDRQALDAAIQTRLGRHQKAGGAIAVGTQTVEQSLDLDADLLFTDLAPIDVLLQRLGRVFRHQRPRPGGFETAQARVLLPTDRDLGALIQGNGEARGRHGLGTVYGDLRILEATCRLVESHPEITTPADCRWLVEDALHPEVLTALVKQDPRFARHEATVLGHTFHQEAMAGLVTGDWQQSFYKLACVERLEGKVATRLGLDDRQVGFSEPVSSPFGHEFNEIKLPGYWMPKDCPPDPTAEWVTFEAGTVRFQVGGAFFAYDRLGLRKDTPKETP